MIVVAGEALIDLLIAGDGSATAKVGGGPMNTARTIARLGSSVAFAGALSDDRFGRMIRAAIEADGIDLSLAPITERPTTLAAAEIDESGAASYRFYLDGTSSADLRTLNVPTASTALHIGGLGVAVEPSASTIETALSALAVDTLVMLDPNCRPAAVGDQREYTQRIERLAERADIVKVSADDLEYLYGAGDHAEQARRLGGDTGVVIVSDGARRVRIVIPDGEIIVPVPAVTVVDTVGAGDSLGGAVLAWWTQSGRGHADLADLDALTRCVTASVQVSAITCTRAGADPPRRDELPTWNPDVSS